jgi:GTP cyclohydrolase I
MEAQDLIKQILKHIGENPSREGLKDTPKRVIKSYEKLFSGYKKNPKDILTVFDSDKYDEMIICKDIEFYSMCEHHMLPFFGMVHIGYIPRKKIVGLSKMPRLVEIFARRLQTQEKLTSQIADNIKDLINPIGVGVIIEAKHLCMMARGIEKQRSEMVTSSMLGAFKNSDKTRSEFLKLIGK